MMNDMSSYFVAEKQESVIVPFYDSNHIFASTAMHRNQALQHELELMSRLRPQS